MQVNNNNKISLLLKKELHVSEKRKRRAEDRKQTGESPVHVLFVWVCP